MATSPEQTGTLVKAARKHRGWSQTRLVSELRRVARHNGQALPADSSVKRRIASWENGHSAPDEFYGTLLPAALSLSAAELGLNPAGGRDAVVLEARYPATPDDAITAVDQLWSADLSGDEPLLCRTPPSPRGATRPYGGS